MQAETTLHPEPGLVPGLRGFKEAMANVVTPVSVVTTMSRDGRPLGATVSAFASLSAAPALVMVALSRESNTLAAIREHGRFGINVLGEGQAPVALAFSTTHSAEKFHDVEWRQHDGVPRLEQSSVWVACALDDEFQGGDHVILVGRVGAVESAGQVVPLTYYQRSFGSHRAQLVDDKAERTMDRKDVSGQQPGSPCTVKDREESDAQHE